MATVSKFANANTVVTTGWTSPTNAYADDASTMSAFPAKNSSITSDFGFPAFTTSDIPAGSTINSVTAEVEYRASTTTSNGAVVGLQLNNSGLLDSESTFGMVTTDTVVTKQATSGITQADLQTANQVKVRVRGARANSNNTITWQVDYVKLTVDYTGPPPTVVLNTADANDFGTDSTPTLEFTGTDADANDIRYNVQIDASADFGGVATYYFNASDAGPTDPNAVWSNDANAFNGNFGDGAFTSSVGSTATNYLQADGTTAPTTGGAITQVRVRIYGAGYSGPQANAAVYTDGLEELLGTATKTSISTGYGNFITLSTPTGGWTWQKVADLETKLYFTNSASFSTISEVELEVTFIGLLDKTSGTDPGFLNTVNGGDTDPFTSGQKVSYTVQAGEELASGTYYWRARGIDPSGSNTYGSFATTRTFSISAGTNITATGKASTLTIGSPSVTPGSVTISATGRNSTTSLGSPTLLSISPINPSSRTSTISIGTPTVSPGAVSRTVTAISSTSSLGSPAVAPGSVSLAPSGINSTASLGTLAVSTLYNLPVSGISSTVAIGSPSVSPGAVTISPSSVTSTSVVNTPSVGALTILNVSGIASTSSLGTPTLQPGSVSVSVTGKSSTLTLGSPTLTPGSVNLSPSGKASSVTFGTLTLTPGSVTISPTGISSSVSIGSSLATPGDIGINPTGKASTSSLGTPSLTPGQVVISTTSITSASSIGSPLVSGFSGSQAISPDSITSTTSIGTVTLASTNSIAPSSITNVSTIGSPSLSTYNVISPSSIGSTLTIGSTLLTPGSVSISQASISETSNVGTVTVTSYNPISVTSITPTTTISQPTVTPGAVSLSPLSTQSTLSIGTVLLSAVGLGEVKIKINGVYVHAPIKKRVNGVYVPVPMKYKQGVFQS